MQCWLRYLLASAIAAYTAIGYADEVRQGHEAIVALQKSFPVTIVPGRRAGVAIYTVTAPQGARHNTNRLLLNLHGGSYLQGAGEAGLDEAILLAHYTRMKVISVDYRMPPHHPFPAALDDATAVWRDIVRTVDPANVGLAGGSAGAGLALAVVMKLKEGQLPLPGAVVAGNPWVDLTQSGDSIDSNTHADIAAHLRAAGRMYAGTYDLRNPLISPLFGDFSRFPPTILITGTRDSLLSDAVRAHRKLRMAGVAADLHVFEALSHGDFIKLPYLPQSREAYREIAAFLDRHLGGAPTPPSLRLYAMDCGRVEVSDARAFSDEHAYDGQRVQGIVPCYLIRHPGGDLIWDVGFPDSMADVPGGVSIPEAHAHVTMRKKLVTQLAELGLEPSDVEYLSLSHSHPDHVGNANLFAHATWIADVEERNDAFSDAARASPYYSNYNLLEHARTRLIEGDGDYDVFGDGSVVIVQAPGHTPGHTVLLVRLLEAGPHLLTGDLWQVPDARRLRTVPIGTRNRSQLLASMDSVEALARQTGARIIRQHVLEDFVSLPAFPQALQ